MMNRIAAHISISLLACACSLQSANLVGSELSGTFYQGPSILANVININRNFPEASFDNRLMISQHGLRLETASHGPAHQPNVFIQNFSSDQAWLVDRTRKIFVEIPRSGEESAEGHGYSSGMAASTACEGLTKTAAGTQRWRGFEVSVWDCGLDNGAIVRQFYSPYWGLVVREESMDGVSSELEKIKRVDLDPALFKPPSDFRATDFMELIRGVSELEEYRHSDAMDNNK